MTRTETACYALIASAFILAGLLFVQVSQTPNAAEASMVITRDNFTLLTARTRTGDESLFIINNNTSKLMIYNLDVGRKNLELASVTDLSRVFSGGGGGGDTDDGGRRGR